MSLTPRQVAKLVQDLADKSEAAVDEALRVCHLDPSTRIAVKSKIAATATRRTLAARLAADAALDEIERLMQRAGLQLGRQYTEADIEEGCRESGITSPTERLGIKLEAEMRQMLKPRRAGQDSRRLYGMRARADERPRGKRLTDARGKPVTLRVLP